MTDDIDFEVITKATDIDPTSISNRSPKKLITAALADGYGVRAVTWRTFERGALIKSGAKAGQRFADKDITHYLVIGTYGPSAKFTAFYNGGSFDFAFVRDIAGWPVELYYDYSPSANDLKQRAGESSKGFEVRAQELRADAERRNYEYNDGALWVNRGRRLVTSMGDFEEWLADVMPSYAQKAPQAEVDEQFSQVTEGVWIG
jgi:hypothetical protein